MKTQADRLTRIFLATDNRAPRVFGRTDRNHLRIVCGVVVEAEDVFAKLRRLRSKRARKAEAGWLCSMIHGNLVSIERIKLTIEFGLADCYVDRAGPLPESIATLMGEHRRLYSLVRQPGGDDNLRAHRLLRLLQLEMIWFGQMW